MVFEAILFLGVLVLAAKIFGEAFHRINQPTIIGNVLAGIVVGPAMFAIVQPIDEIELFVSIGVFFLDQEAEYKATIDQIEKMMIHGISRTDVQMRTGLIGRRMNGQKGEMQPF